MIFFSVQPQRLYSEEIAYQRTINYQQEYRTRPRDASQLLQPPELVVLIEMCENRDRIDVHAVRPILRVNVPEQHPTVQTLVALHGGDAGVLNLRGQQTPQFQ